MMRHQLSSVDFATNARMMKKFYVGDKNEKLTKSLRKSEIQQEIVTDFYRKLRTAHNCCGTLHPEETRLSLMSKILNPRATFKFEVILRKFLERFFE